MGPGQRKPWDDGGHQGRGVAARTDGHTRDGGPAAGQPLPSGGRGDPLSLGGRAGHGGQRGGDRPGVRVPPTASVRTTPLPDGRFTLDGAITGTVERAGLVLAALRAFVQARLVARGR